MTEPYEREVVRQETAIGEPVNARPSATPVAPVTQGEPVASNYSRTSVTSVREGTSNWRAEQVIWFVVGLIDVLIGIRFILKLFGASTASAFVRFMYDLTAVLVAPFHGIFNTAAEGRSVFEPESLVAIAIYTLIGWGIIALIRVMTRPRSTTIVQ